MTLQATYAEYEFFQAEEVTDTTISASHQTDSTISFAACGIPVVSTDPGGEVSALFYFQLICHCEWFVLVKSAKGHRELAVLLKRRKGDIMLPSVTVRGKGEKGQMFCTSLMLVCQTVVVRLSYARFLVTLFLAYIPARLSSSDSEWVKSSMPVCLPL